MGFLRRFLSVGLGLAAGAAAYKIMSDYNRDGHIEGEFVEVIPAPQPAEPAEQAEQVRPEEVPHPEEPVWHPASGPDAPNHNPVNNGPAPQPPVDEEGKLDPTKIASQEDFQDWSDCGGCKG